MRHSLLLLAVATVAPFGSLAAQPRGMSIEGIFRRGEFASQPMPAVDWLKDGRSYVELRADPAGGTDIVKVDVVTGAATVLADASALTSGGRRLAVEEITLSDDESKALLFHASRRVWRTNTRGIYEVYDFASRTLTTVVREIAMAPMEVDRTDTANAPRLGQRPPSFLGRGLASGAVDPDLQQFAKFSPDGRMVAYVRANDLWVTDLATGQARRLTTDGSDDIINGTADWVYEEELGLADAFAWSPDSRRIAYWRFDQRDVPAYPIVNELELYPVVSVLRYPKAGQANSRVKVGVLDAMTAGSGARTRWLETGPDTGSYLARMHWLGADSLVVQRLNRRQDRNDVLVLSATSGAGRVMFTDRDSAYVDVNDGPVWLAGERQFLWLSDRSGWRAVHLVDRAGRTVRQLSRPGIDVLGIAGVDEARGAVYVVAAAPDPTQRQVFRATLDGRRWERVTAEQGAHALQVAPGARYAIDVRSALGEPARAAVYALPAMTKVRDLAQNQPLRERLAAERLRAPEFIKVPTPSGMLDGYRIVPADFDSTRKYPVLMYTYGGPAAPQVVDQWGGTRYLWHQMLAQRGYVVVVVDNRGAAWRGNAFRKATQLQLGRLEAQDQVEAARWLRTRPWVDGANIGIWGWSYGGYLSSLTAMRGGDLFKAAMAVAPVADWRLYDTIYTERFMWVPSENREGYEGNAPVREVAGLTARFLLAHGTGDDNVHPQNTTQLTEALVRANKQFVQLMYPNRTHSITGDNATAHLYEALTRFVEESLCRPGQPCVAPTPQPATP